MCLEYSKIKQSVNKFCIFFSGKYKKLMHNHPPEVTEKSKMFKFLLLKQILDFFSGKYKKLMHNHPPEVAEKSKMFKFFLMKQILDFFWGKYKKLMLAQPSSGSD